MAIGCRCTIGVDAHFFVAITFVLAYNFIMVKQTRTADIELGTGACYAIGSDRYPATVIAKTASTITVQNDTFTAGEGHNYFGAQVWNFSPNPLVTVWATRGRATASMSPPSKPRNE